MRWKLIYANKITQSDDKVRSTVKLHTARTPNTQCGNAQQISKVENLSNLF